MSKQASFSGPPGRLRKHADRGRMAYEPAPRILERRRNGLTIRFYGPRDLSGAVTQQRPRARASNGSSPVKYRGSRRTAQTSRAGPDDDPDLDEPDIAASVAFEKGGGQ